MNDQNANAAADQPVEQPALDPEVQHNLDKANYVAMLKSNIPTLHAEYLAGRYLLAEMTNAGDVKVLKQQFMKVAGRVQGGVPPLTEVALRIIAGKPRK